MSSRNRIIATLRLHLEPNPQILAMWLEGADATGTVEVLRMQYTPLHPDYYIVHISRHLPSPVLRRLEALFQVNSIAEIERKHKEALTFFEETIATLTSEMKLL